MTDTVVLAYSGGLDTSVAIPWLAEEKGFDVVCLLVDVGQPMDGVKDALDRATENGAVEARTADVKEAFVEDYVHPALKANARYEGAYPLATALSRPLIAEQLVDVAHDVGATRIAHGCTAKGNDQVRFEVSVRALDPDLWIVAPLREWRPTRAEAVAYANERGVQLPPFNGDSPFSVDENLWGRSIEGGAIEDLGQAVPGDAWAWTTDPKDAPDRPETVTLAFEAGAPTTLNGKDLTPVELVQLLNAWAGAHGVGRIDHVENRLVGFKSREAYEAPAATVLIEAHRALEQATLTKDVAHFKPQLEQRFAELVYDGHWFSPLREALQAFLDAAQAPVAGEVDVELYKGRAAVTARRPEAGLYDHGLATYGAGDDFDHGSAEGFIDLWGLPLRTAARARDRTSGQKGQGA